MLHAFLRTVICLTAAAGLGVPAAAAGDLTVFAAASLKNALGEAAAAYEAETGDRVHLSFAGSSALARQVQMGAPADVFISANPGWMDEVETEGLIVDDSRINLLSNRLVLVAHSGPMSNAELARDVDLLARLEGGRLAMALADAVPAGIYAKAALQWMGQWEAVSGSAAQAGNVRIALALVARGEAGLGIVYASDAAAERGVVLAGVFPIQAHPTIVYPAAALTGGDAQAAARFLSHLQSEASRATFIRHGFAVPELPE